MKMPTELGCTGRLAKGQGCAYDVMQEGSWLCRHVTMAGLRKVRVALTNTGRGRGRVVQWVGVGVGWCNG